MLEAFEGLGDVYFWGFRKFFLGLRENITSMNRFKNANVKSLNKIVIVIELKKTVAEYSTRSDEKLNVKSFF